MGRKRNAKDYDSICIIKQALHYYGNNCIKRTIKEISKEIGEGSNVFTHL